MPIKVNKYNCSGCTACSSICPKNCISMVEDALGFKYPVIDKSKCINCDLCVKVCQFKADYEVPVDALSNPIAVWGKSKNQDEIVKSQSGGAFAVLSDFIIENEGVVYGVGYGKGFEICHKRATNKSERDEFRGSKYVQSNIEGIFKSIKDDLIKGKTVLFSGTPCQTAGLLGYIPLKLTAKLITIDIVCHGVPSPRFWKDYIRYIENKHKAEIKHINFRDKSIKGWRAHIESYELSNGKKITMSTQAYIFYLHIMLRNSCSKCPFTNFKRPSDITIADAWHIEKTKDTWMADDNKGCSSILINSKKGLDLFNSIKYRLIYKETGIDNFLHSPLHRNTKFSDKRERFEEDYKSKSFRYILRKYGNIGISYQIRRLQKLINKFIGK